VGNLPFTATDQDLYEIFAECGEIQHARVATDRETQKSRGFGHVDFVDGNSVDAAMAKTWELYGRELRTDFGKSNDGPARGGRGGRGGFQGGRGGARGGFGGDRGGRGGFRGGRGGSAPTMAQNAQRGSIANFEGKKMTFDESD